jgi:hypothetical protein
MIRDATFSDIPAMRRVLQWAYDHSAYAGGPCGFDEKEATRLLVHAVQGHKAGAFVQVAEHEGAIEGLIVGMKARVYHVGTRNMASDLFWVATDKVHARDPRLLMKAFIAWAKGEPDVIEIRCGVTAVLQDPDKAGRILESLGMERYGAIYRKGL